MITSEFNKNVFTLMIGTTIAQIVPVIISPILTRLYTPEDFGVFALFLSITMMIGSIANGRYELAIVLPKKDEDAINIATFSFIITCIISIMLFCLVLLFNESLTLVLRNEKISIWLYFIPIVVFLTGLFNVLNYYNVRKKNYAELAKVNIIKSIILAVLQVIVAYIKEGVYGLISGQIISQLFANTKLLKNILENKRLISKISKIKMIALARRYKDFPKYSLLATFANISSQQLINIFIPVFYNMATLGFYSLVQKILGMPTSLIGSAVGQVFLQQATQEKQQTGKIIKSFKSTIKKLIYIGTPSFGIFFFIIEDICTFVFGEEWKIVGEYARILTPLFFIRFISATLSLTLIIFEKQKSELMINILLLITTLLLIILVKDFNTFLYVFSFFMGVNYLFFIIYYYILSK